MDKVNAILSRFPQYAYSIATSDTIVLGATTLGSGRLNRSANIHKLVEAIVDEFNITMSNIDRIDRMINIDTVLPDDLYNRFGALLNINRNINETDEQYRNRLKVSVTSLSGGTASAIKYAIASGLGINNDEVAMDRICVYDAWEYTGSSDVKKEYGYVVCEIDLNQGTYSTNMEDIIAESANNVKASGVAVQFVYYNFRITYYMELDDLTYASLNTSTYSQVGE